MDDIEQDIEEKDIGELKKKNKPIRSTLKKCLVGVLITGTIITAIPNIQYGIEKVKAKYNTNIENIINSEDKTKKIEELYRQAIMKNKNIDEDVKEKLIQSFTNQVIIPYGNYFTDETILNMIAVASTQKIETMSEFFINHSWWSGDYMSFLNTLSVEETSDEILLAHEELHAILKSGILGSGLTSGIKGYAINEGLTSSFVNEDKSYSEEVIIADMLRLILGNSNLIEYYLEGDLKGLSNELSTYIPKTRADELFFYLDLNIFSEYLETFLVRNFGKNQKDQYINDDKRTSKMQEKLEQDRFKRTYKIQEIMKEIFEAKYNCKAEESKLGRIIFGKGSNYFDNNWDIDEPLYIVKFLNNEQIEVSLMFLGFNDYYKDITLNINELDQIDFDKIIDDFSDEYKNVPKKHFFMDEK